MSTASASTPLLVVEGLGIQVRGKALLRDISFALHAGEALTLVGESGAGKSLLAQAIMGNLPPALQATGQITLDGTTTRAQDAAARRALWGRKLALLPQEPSLALNPLARVAPQLAEVYRLLHQQPPSAASAQAEQVLGAAGLGGAGSHYPWQLSGGMAQRAVAAITLAGGAPVLMVDEPTKGLDPEACAQVAALLMAAQTQGQGLLTITHDLELAAHLGGRIAVLRHGCIVEQGPATEVLQAPRHPYTRALLAAIDHEPSHCTLRAERARRAPEPVDAAGTALGVRAAKCVATSSIISPAPTNSTRVSFRSSNNCEASRTAAAVMLMEWAPISVELRTSLATANERWNSWCSVLPRAPASLAARTASFI